MWCYCLPLVLAQLLFQHSCKLLALPRNYCCFPIFLSSIPSLFSSRCPTVHWKARLDLSAVPVCYIMHGGGNNWSTLRLFPVIVSYSVIHLWCRRPSFFNRIVLKKYSRNGSCYLEQPSFMYMNPYSVVPGTHVILRAQEKHSRENSRGLLRSEIFIDYWLTAVDFWACLCGYGLHMGRSNFWEPRLTPVLWNGQTSAESSVNFVDSLNRQ